MGRGGEAFRKCNTQIIPGIPSPAIIFEDMKRRLIKIFETYKVYVIFFGCLSVDFILNYITLVNFFGFARLNSFFFGLLLTLASLLIFGFLFIIYGLYHSTQ